MSQLPLRELDAPALREWAAAAHVELAHAREEIDAINVYPVPDADTGTNLYLTFAAAVEGLASVPDSAGPRVVLDALAGGALLGARGNSGVILSQVLRGLAEVLGDDPADAGTTAGALSRAAETAYAAVAEPAEGTMLTVLRAAALAVAEEQDLAALVVAAAAAAREALARTPEQLEVLRHAGVVDAGGRGICVLLDVLERVVTGGSTGLEADEHRARPLAHPSTSGGAAWPTYEVMFLLDAPAASIPPLRAALTALGNSVVLAGAEPSWNVHAHVDDVGSVIEAAVSAGRPRAIRITNLHEGHRVRVPPEAERAVVVVLDAEGFAELFEAAGATIAVRSWEPASPAEVSSALAAAAADEIIVVPTDEAGYEVARAAAEERRADGLRVEVVPARVPVQALAALTAHDPLCRFEDDVLQMTAAAARCRHGAVSFAEPGGGPTSSGQRRAVVGTIDADVVASGTSAAQVACEVVDRLLAGGGVQLSLISGSAAPGELAAAVTAHVHHRRPELDIVVYDAPHPSVLLVGVE